MKSEEQSKEQGWRNEKIEECVDGTIECMCRMIQSESTSVIVNKSGLSEMTAALAALITASVMLKREGYLSRVRHLKEQIRKLQKNKVYDE